MVKSHSSKGPLDFLQTTLDNDELGKKIREAITKGGLVTAKEVMGIAHAEGYDFSQEEFQDALLAEYRKQFAAGDQSLAVVAGPNAPTSPPESSCQKGCISWTYNHYHPGHPRLTAGSGGRG